MVPKTNASPRPATMVAIRSVSCGIETSSHSRTPRALRRSEAPQAARHPRGTRSLLSVHKLTKWCLVTIIDIRQRTLHTLHRPCDGECNVRSIDFFQLLQTLDGSVVSLCGVRIGRLQRKGGRNGCPGA